MPGVPDIRSPAMRRIVAYLEKAGAAGIDEIAAGAAIAVNTLKCGGYIAKLRDEGVIYVSGWRRKSELGGFTTPIFSVGNLPDVPRPVVSKLNADGEKMREIEELLAEMPGLGCRQIAKAVGLSLTQVQDRLIKALKAQERVWISGWKRSRQGMAAPLFSAGNGMDVPPPLVLSRSEIAKRYRLRQKARTPRSTLHLLLAGTVPQKMSRHGASA